MFKISKFMDTLYNKSLLCFTRDKDETERQEVKGGKIEGKLRKGGFIKVACSSVCQKKIL